MKKLKKMSFSDLNIILQLAQTELDYWNGCISNDIHKEDIKIAKEQSKKFFLFKYYIEEATREKLYSLSEEYNQ